MPSETPRPPSGYKSWLDWWTSAQTAIGGLGGLYECGLARDELNVLREQLKQARNTALDEAMAVAAPYAAAHPIGMAILEKIESLKGS